MVIIFIQSSIPDLSPPDMGFKLQDKFAHVIEFAILGVLLLRAFKSGEKIRNIKQVNWLTIFCGGFYAVFDEIHQYFVPGRLADIYDVLADIAGIFLVIILNWLVTNKKLFSIKSE